MRSLHLLPCLPLIGVSLAQAAMAGPLLLEGPGASAPAPDPTAIRVRTAVIDSTVLEGLAPGRRLEFNLFGDVAFTGVVTRSYSPRTWSGTLEGQAGSFTIAGNGAAISVLVRDADGRVFRVRSAGGAAVVQEVSVAGLAACADPLVPAGAPGGANGAAGGVAGLPTCADGSVITVAIVYTPISRDAAGGTAAIEAEIDLSVAVANQAYVNSLINMQLQLVFAGEVDYAEPGSYQGHLVALTNPNDGKMDEVHGIRYFQLADLVDLFVQDGQYCGIAWLMTDNSAAFDPSGFSVTTWYCAGANQTLAHELGHNMGCCHAPGDGGGCLSGGLFDWSVGYRFNGNSGTLWRDIMAYPPGTRIPNFSNPQVWYDGQATGVPAGGPNGADNAATINLTAPTIANFRCAIPFCQSQQLAADDGEPDDLLGASVSLDGTALAVGAPLDDDNGHYSGSAYLLRRTGSTGSWSQEDKLLPEDGAAEDLFGLSVSISGDAAVAGAPHHAGSAPQSGAAYVFRKKGGAWLQEQELLASDGASGDHFGQTVAISGEYLVAGAEHDDDANGLDSGSAYLFARQGGSWTQQAKLTASNGSLGARFGHTVAIDGDVVVVGEPALSGGFTPGSAYVFRRAGSGPTWVQEAILQANDSGNYNSFGSDVAVDGEVVMVGATADGAQGEGAGAAYVFRKIGGSWIQDAKLLPPDVGDNDTYGSSVSVRGALAIVGAVSDNDNGNGSGSAYVYRNDGGTWTQTAKLLAPEGVAFDGLGVDVAIDGPIAVAGAFGAGVDGAVYAFRGFSGADCNGNALLDDCEVIAGTAPDLNGNGVPDECDNPADLDGDGTVGILDFLMLLSVWGPCPDCGVCLGDLDGNCSVGVADLLSLLGSWG